ncbi:DUF4173 domain-containing protein [Kitasatospora sp. NPDC048540]|uniref:DUF4153 domain-containing protein n=1 Tax=unclassified Kitasatospora TaxID=2633591 RepID=UPI0009EAD984|nr:DUF4173 domain-containing protein [Kitasatospora sp. MBT63]
MNPYRSPYPQTPPPAWVKATEPQKPASPGPWVALAGIGAGLVTALLLGDGLGVNLLICALAAAGVAALTARSAHRRARPWTLVWAASALGLLIVPAVSAAAWPTAVAILVAAGVGSLALHGGTRWAGVLLGSVGFWGHLMTSVPWAAAGLRTDNLPSRNRVVPVLKAVAVSVGLLVVFGALFASADETVANLLGDLTPSIDVDDLPLRVLLFVLGLLVALGAAHTVAAPRRWDRLPIAPGKPRSLVEWALPMTALSLLFGVFVTVQAVAVFGGGLDAVRTKPGVIPAEFAREGFWQLLWVIVLTLAVVVLAARWAPRATAGDRLTVRVLLSVLCALTVAVVASAMYRMHLYVDAFGLTRLRVSVAAVELWLGVVFVLIVVAVLMGSQRWLPRAVVLSAVVGAAVLGLITPDSLIAEQNVARYERTGKVDVAYLRSLSADAVPALDRLTGDRRACALELISADLADGAPWYATSLSEARARAILRDRPVPQDASKACRRLGVRTGDEYP